MTVPRTKKTARRGLSTEALETIASRFRALAEPNRLRLIMALESGEQNVNYLVDATGLSQANVSRHLQTLADAGILSRRRNGLHVLYSIADPAIFELCEHVCGSLQRRHARHAAALNLR